MTLQEQINALEAQLVQSRIEQERIAAQLRVLNYAINALEEHDDAKGGVIGVRSEVIGRPRRRRGEDAEPSPYSGDASENLCDGVCSHCGAPQRRRSMTCRNCNAD